MTARLAGTVSSPAKGTVPQYPQEHCGFTDSAKSPVITRQVRSDEVGLQSNWVVKSADQNQQDTKLDTGIHDKKALERI